MSNDDELQKLAEGLAKAPLPPPPLAKNYEPLYARERTRTWLSVTLLVIFASKS